MTPVVSFVPPRNLGKRPLCWGLSFDIKAYGVEGARESGKNKALGRFGPLDSEPPDLELSGQS